MRMISFSCLAVVYCSMIMGCGKTEFGTDQIIRDGQLEIAYQGESNAKDSQRAISANATTGQGSKSSGGEGSKSLGGEGSKSSGSEGSKSCAKSQTPDEKGLEKSSSDELCSCSCEDESSDDLLHREREECSDDDE